MTITRAFGFTLDTQTGAVERWAAGDPAEAMQRARQSFASVAVEHASGSDSAPVVGFQQLATLTPRPSGSQCVQCVSRASDCSGLDFAAMRPAGRPDADGVQRVACTGYRRGDALPTLAQIRDKLGPLADAEVLGIVKPRPCRCGPDGCSVSDCAGRRHD